MKVRAISLGYYNLLRRRPGAVFDVKPYEYFDCDRKGKPRMDKATGEPKTSTWMEPLDPKEASGVLADLMKNGAKLPPARKGLQRHSVVPVGTKEVAPSVGTFREGPNASPRDGRLEARGAVLSGAPGTGEELSTGDRQVI